MHVHLLFSPPPTGLIAHGTAASVPRDIERTAGAQASGCTPCCNPLLALHVKTWWHQSHAASHTWQHCVQEEVQGLGPQAAHSGVLTAAAAVYKDLQRHRILEELLQGSKIPPLPGQQQQHPEQAAGPSDHSQHRRSRQAGSKAQDAGAAAAGRAGSTPSSSASSEDASVSGNEPAASPHSRAAQAERQPSGTDVRKGGDGDESSSAGRGSQEDGVDAEAGTDEAGVQANSTMERHKAMEETVVEGQRMVARLVQESNQAEGDVSSGPEARAEEERQLGSLRARKLDCRVRACAHARWLPGRLCAPTEGSCMTVEAVAAGTGAVYARWVGQVPASSRHCNTLRPAHVQCSVNL